MTDTDHRVTNGDGTSEMVDCETYQRYVENGSWYARVQTLETQLATKDAEIAELRQENERLKGAEDHA